MLQVMCSELYKNTITALTVMLFRTKLMNTKINKEQLALRELWVKLNCPTKVKVNKVYNVHWSVCPATGELYVGISPNSYCFDKNDIWRTNYSQSLRRKLAWYFDRFDAADFGSPQVQSSLITDIMTTGGEFDGEVSA